MHYSKKVQTDGDELRAFAQTLLLVNSSASEKTHFPMFSKYCTALSNCKFPYTWEKTDVHSKFLNISKLIVNRTSDGARSFQYMFFVQNMFTEKSSLVILY